MQRARATAVPASEGQTPDLGQIIDSRAILNVPLNGRNFSQLVPSAEIAPAKPGAAYENTLGFSSNGIRTYQNNYRLDNIDSTANITDLQTRASYVI
jgi:hypothetical protein